MNTPARPTPSAWNAQFGRRNFLASMAAGAVVVGAGSALTACGTGQSSTGVSGPGGSPRVGGTFQLGAQGGANTDTLDGQNPLTNTDFCRTFQLYDQLTVLDDQAQVRMALAKSVTPNGNGTEWTIVLRDGITTHRGKAFTAHDVLYSLNRIVAKKFPGASSIGPIDLASSRVVSPTTLILKYSAPFAILPEVLTSGYMTMVPQNYNPKDPDGTGPFMYKSFTPGVSSTFVRNPHYWGHGPYFDEIITTNFADETSQVNALQAGQVDSINYLSAASIATLQSAGMNVNVSKTGGWGPFVMRTDRKPFDDVRVRQAFRLIVDRKQMLDQVFNGRGTIGNDVFGNYDPGYAKDLPQREQDIPQAKSLLKAAGADNLTIQLITTPNAPGMVSAAQVFATQAKQAGVNVNVVQQNTTDFFANSFFKATFSQDYWQTGPYLFDAGQALIKGAIYNWTRFDDPEYASLFNRAIAEVDTSKRNDLISQMCHIDYDRGGYLIPYFFPTIDAESPRIGGVHQSADGYSPCGNDFASLWKA